MSPVIRKRTRAGHPAADNKQVIAHGHNWSKPLELRIEYVAPGSLQLPKRAVRNHGKKQLTQVEASIRRFGHIQPLVVDAENTIICGVARYLAAQQLGLSRVPVIRLDHLSDAELSAFRLADNKLAEGATWDSKLLAVELQERLCQTNVAGRAAGW